MPKRLISRIAVTAFVLAASASAFAADIAVKSPPPAPAPVPTWTGWYVGGNVGASFGTFKTDFNVAPITVTTTSGPFTIPGFSQFDEVYPGGFVGGGQIGFNWQFSPIWVVGLEADFQGTDEKNGSTLTHPIDVIALSNRAVGTTVTNYQAEIEWFGTVRLRAGYLWGDGTVLSYVTGGLAYGEVKTGGTTTASGFFGLPANTFSITHGIGHSQVRTGWTIGSGTEGKLLIPGWTYKIEALYMDLGHLNDTDDEVVVPSILSVSGGQVTTHTHFTDTILRAGLNYQFH